MMSLQIIDEPIPEDCYAKPNADYDGFAVQWGLGHKARSAAECCRLCKDFKKNNPTAPNPCNVWVWCGDPSGGFMQADRQLLLQCMLTGSSSCNAAV